MSIMESTARSSRQNKRKILCVSVQGFVMAGRGVGAFFFLCNGSLGHGIGKELLLVLLQLPYQLLSCSSLEVQFNL